MWSACPARPDLNPDEGLWNAPKRVELKNRCCRDRAAVRLERRRASERLRHHRDLIRSCSAHCGYSVWSTKAPSGARDSRTRFSWLDGSPLIGKEERRSSSRCALVSCARTLHDAEYSKGRATPVRTWTTKVSTRRRGSARLDTPLTHKAYHAVDCRSLCY